MENALRGAIQANSGPVLKNGIKGVHEAFADYMLINPGCTLREMAGVFNYSASWICTVINSDMFKAYFDERRKEINCVIAEDLPSKLAAAGHLATERIMEVLNNTEDAGVIIDSFDKVMHRLGYAPNAKGGPQGNITQNNTNIFYMNKEELAGVRQAFLAAHAPVPALPAPEKDVSEVTPTST